MPAPIRIAISAVIVALVGCAEMPQRAPVEGQIDSVSKRDLGQIIAVAKAELARTGRAAEPVYSVYIERPGYAYAYFGQRRVHYDDREQAIVVERLHGRWQTTGGMVSGPSPPVG